MQVQAQNLYTDATESNKNVERRSLFARLVLKEVGAVEDCLKEHGSFVWALAKAQTDSVEEAEKLSEEIFAQIWKYAERFNINICDEKKFVSLIACRYLLLHKKHKSAAVTANTA